MIYLKFQVPRKQKNTHRSVLAVVAIVCTSIDILSIVTWYRRCHGQSSRSKGEQRRKLHFEREIENYEVGFIGVEQRCY
jgi:hypothetical protein